MPKTRHYIRRLFARSTPFASLVALLATLLACGATASAVAAVPDPGSRPGSGSPSGSGSGADPGASRSAVPDPSPGPGAGLRSGSGGGPRGSGSELRSGDPREQGAKVFNGQGFDTCVAPSLDTMQAWKESSPFGAVGVYFGGRGRSCPEQPNLDRDWVSQVHGMGWRILPLYVGSQAPCVIAEQKRQFAMGDEDPAQQGAREGRDAVARARELGMSKHSALYLDMEAYEIGDSQCADTTLEFVQGWDRAVHAAGYLPGFYSNAGSGITHMENAREAGSGDLPEMMWFARWGVTPSVRYEQSLSPDAWQPHRRIHQYDGDVTREYGGYRLRIDRNLVDAPVATFAAAGGS